MEKSDIKDVPLLEGEKISTKIQNTENHATYFIDVTDKIQQGIKNTEHGASNMDQEIDNSKQKSPNMVHEIDFIGHESNKMEQGDDRSDDKQMLMQDEMVNLEDVDDSCLSISMYPEVPLIQNDKTDKMLQASAMQSTEPGLDNTEQNVDNRDQVIDKMELEINIMEQRAVNTVPEIDGIGHGTNNIEQEDDGPCKKEMLKQDEMVKIENDDDSFRKLWMYEEKRVSRPVVKFQIKDPTRAERRALKKKEKDMKKNICKETEEEFVCDYCDQQFITLAALISHKKKHIKEIKYTCALCSQVFNTNQELIEHKIVHKDEQNFLCMKCEIAFTDHLMYLKHKLTHQNIETYNCVECGGVYKSKNGFQIHIETHFDTAKECEICQLKIKSSSMVGHMKTHKGIGIKCGECGKFCGDTSSLRRHMTFHTGVKLIQCFYCGKGFCTKQQRTIHTRIHTGEKPFTCNVCHTSFRQQTDLLRHQNTHETEKKHQCTICNKKYFRKESLRDHMDLHNNTQRYKCDICGMRFHIIPSLKQHMIRTHTTGKNFHCELCDAHFKTKGDLYKHRRSKKHLNNEYGRHKNKQPI